MPRPRPFPDHQGWCAYLVRCADGSLYAGATNDLALRVARHDAGKGAAYTRSRRPVRLAWFEPAADRSAALQREAALKRLSRAEKLVLVGGVTYLAPPSRKPAGAARTSRSARASPRRAPRT